MLKVVILSLMLMSQALMAQSYDFNLERFSHYASETKADNRVIEGASPILGYELSQTLKNHEDHPALKLKRVLKVNPDYTYKAQLSTLSYLETFQPGLEEYCAQDKIVTGKRSKWTPARGNHGAAIPQEVLVPKTAKYLERLSQNSLLSKESVQQKSLKAAKKFQETRYQCKNVIKLMALEDKLEKLCLGLRFCKKAKAVNSIISSAEAAYPRKQFSVNGFTRYVYHELLKSETLEEDLRTIYDLQQKWLVMHRMMSVEKNFFEFVITEALEKDIHIKDILLILAYSMRNMPSLDIEFALAPKKALMLEIYFWDFRDIRDELSRKEYKGLRFSHNFKRNPGFYHYLTAALLGCEARLAGLSHSVATLMGIASKVGYKTDKLTKAVEKHIYQELNLKNKVDYLNNLMKKQAFWPGVAAGYHAAKFGSKACIAYKRELKKDYREEKRELRKKLRNRKLFREQKEELKRELKESFRSVLEDVDV
jgi:hypothetical protein